MTEKEEHLKKGCVQVWGKFLFSWELVPKAGLEPARGYPHRPLKTARLPIPPLRHVHHYFNLDRYDRQYLTVYKAMCAPEPPKHLNMFCRLVKCFLAL